MGLELVTLRGQQVTGQVTNWEKGKRGVGTVRRMNAGMK